jgi:hypothetical protein
MSGAMSAPPLTIGQMIKVVSGEYKGATGVLVEQKRMKFLVQIIGDGSHTKVYLLPTNIKPMYLSDSPRPQVSLPGNTQMAEAPHKHLDLSPSPSNVSSITSPTMAPHISAPDGSTFRKYKSGPIEPGHGVRIIGGTYKGLRGFVIEQQRVKLLVRLEHSEEDVLLMPSNLGPWERSAAHAVLKQRRNKKEGTNVAKQEEHSDRPRGASPLRSFWSPGKERMVGEDGTVVSGESNSTGSGLDLVYSHTTGDRKSSSNSGLDLAYSHTGDLGGVRIDLLSSDDQSNDSLTENNDPSKAVARRATEKGSTSRSRQDVVSPNRLGSPLRRRRARLASPDNAKNRLSSPVASDRSIFKRKGSLKKPDSHKHISASTSSTVSSTDPSTTVSSEPASMNTTDHLHTHKERQQNRQNVNSQSQDGSLTTASSRSIFQRKKSPVRNRRIEIAPLKVNNNHQEEPAQTHHEEAFQKKKPTPARETTSKPSTPKELTQKSSTPRGSSTPKESTKSPKALTPSGLTEVVTTPRMALREKFTFKNVQKNSTASRDAAPKKSRQLQETKPAAPSLKSPQQPPEPAEVKRSLSPLMLRRRTMSRTKDAMAKKQPSTTVARSFSLSPRLDARRRGSRIQAAREVKQGEMVNHKETTAKKHAVVKRPFQTPPKERLSYSKTSKTENSNSKSKNVSVEKEETREPVGVEADEPKLSKRSENRLLMRQAIKKRGKKTQEQREGDESEVSASDASKSQSGEDLDPACSWSFSTTASTEALLKKYSEGVSKPAPTPTISVVNASVEEPREEAASDTQLTASTEPKAATSSFVPVVEQPEEAVPRKEEEGKKYAPSPRLIKVDSNIEAPSDTEYSAKPPMSPKPSPKSIKSDVKLEARYDADFDEDEEEIIAKYNQILERRMKAMKERQKSEQSSEEIKNCYISEDEESDSFGGLSLKQQQQQQPPPTTTQQQQQHHNFHSDAAKGAHKVKEQRRENVEVAAAVASLHGMIERGVPTCQMMKRAMDLVANGRRIRTNVEAQAMEVDKAMAWRINKQKIVHLRMFVSMITLDQLSGVIMVKSVLLLPLQMTPVRLHSGLVGDDDGRLPWQSQRGQVQLSIHLKAIRLNRMVDSTLLASHWQRQRSHFHQPGH